MELGEELSLAFETGESLLVLDERRRQNLDRDFTPQLGVAPSLAVIS